MSARKFRSSWWVDFSWRGDRVRRRSPLNSKSGAREFEITLRRHLAAHGTLTDFGSVDVSHAPTFAEFSERWLRDAVDVHNRAKERAQKRCVLRRHLLPMFGAMPMNAVDAAAIDAFVARGKSLGLREKTINNHVAILRRCLACARDWGVIDRVPRVRMLRTMAPEFRFLDEREEVALLKSFDDSLFRTMALVALRTGLRYSELVALRWCDVDFRSNSIVVRRTVVDGVEGPTKNNRTRQVPLTPDVRETLAAFDRDAGLVFAICARSINYDTAWRRMAVASCRAGIAPVMWHDLRHTFASRLVARGAPLPAVQQLLGHASVQTTMRYTHLAPSTLASVVALLAPATPPANEFRATGGQRAGDPTRAPGATRTYESAILR